MLSLQRCRQLLAPACTLTDGELQMLCEQLYKLAHVMIGTTNSIRGPAHVLPEDHDVIEERAAILEFDGGLSRESAERAAIGLYRQAER